MPSTSLFSFNFAEIGLFLIGCGYLFVFWRQGGNQASHEVIEAYKEQVIINGTKITDLTKEIGILTGQLKEKDARIALLETLAKTTPEQQIYMDDMRKFTIGVANYMDSSTKTMGEISVFLHNLNIKT